MRTFLLYISLLTLAASLMSCQKKDVGVSFDSIYSNNDINKIVIRDKNLKIIEITDIERINKWVDKVGEIKLIRDKNQEERDFLLTYDGCLVKVFHHDEEIGDFKQLKLKGVYYQVNEEFDQRVELLCGREM